MKRTQICVYRHVVLAVVLVVIALSATPSAIGQTLTGYPDALQFFKNYFVTGDYVVGGVGLRGRGDASGLATGYIQISGIPSDAVVVGAFLYWETIESTATPSSMNGYFQGYPIVGVSRGTGTSPCWSSGGGTGSSNGAKTLRVYRADVAPYLVVNGQYATNTANIPNFSGYQVRLPDSGSNGGGTPLTEGASLVIIYRTLSAPLRAVSIYDGSWTMNNATQYMSQTIDWFYQSLGSANAHLTHIVGDGQSNFGENIYFQDGTTSTLLNSQGTFTGAQGYSWDDPVYNVAISDGSNIPLTQDRQSAVATYVVPDASSFDCLSWGAVVFSTPVIDGDQDGLLDVWEDRQGYKDSKDGTTWVALPGANKTTKDLFVQVDFLKNTGASSAAAHSHLPKLEALSTMSGAFAKHGINVHFDVGAYYQGNTFIVPSGSGAALGGNALDEDTVSCTDGTTLCDFPYSLWKVPGIVSWKAGVLNAKNQFFQHGRKDSYHYLLAGHALGFPNQTWSVPDGTLVNVTVSGGTATVTTSSPHGLFAGNRVSISGALGDYNLNGAYNIVSASTTTFSVSAPNVAAGVYGSFPSQQLGYVLAPNGIQSNEPNLTVSSGGPLSISGFSDLGGGDSLITLGLWKADDATGCQADPSVPLAPDGSQRYCNNLVGSATVQAGTMMHEIGHTLYLTHGGFYPAQDASHPAYFGQNCKPNFLSVMNYIFQIRGLPNNLGIAGGAAVDYSAQLLGTLDETNLVEANGLGVDQNGAVPAYGTRWYAPPSVIDKAAQNNLPTRYAASHCDGTPRQSNELVVRVEGGTAALNGSGVYIPSAINWNNASPTTETVVDQDINFDGASNDSSLNGFSDWNNMYFQQMGSRRNVYGFSADVSAADIANGVKILGGGVKILGGGSDLINAGSQLLGSGVKILGGGVKILGGGRNLLGGGLEVDFDIANSTVDPPVNFSGSQTGKTSVSLSWFPPSFGQIRTYYVWRANITKAPISTTNPPVLLATLTGPTFATSYTDNTVKVNQTYVYYASAGLIADGGPTSGNQSGPSNFATITIVQFK